jgi:hypothetical protein
MAITQISQITVRKGLQQDLPQLAGGEFGWAIDTGNLYIGNGTLAEGAPALGLTQIATLTGGGSGGGGGSGSYHYNSTYSAGFTPATPNPAVVRPTNDKLSDIVSVYDFGAVGDGQTDDTYAIQSAIGNLYAYSQPTTGTNSSTINPAARKALYFPAGVYRVNQTITIPSYCTIFGEGLDHTFIVAGNTSFTLANTVNSQDLVTGLTGNIAQGIYLHDITLQGNTASPTILQLNSVADARFDNVRFAGMSQATGDTYSAVSLGNSQASLIHFNDCEFSGTGTGIYNQANLSVDGLTVAGSLFTNVNRGIWSRSGSNNIADVNFTHNLFENIKYEAIRAEAGTRVSSTSDIFVNVGNQLGNAVIWANVVGFSSASDLFDRLDGTFPRIVVNNQPAIFTDNTASINLGLRKLGINTIENLLQANTAAGNIAIDNMQTVYGSGYGYTVNYTANTATSFRKGKLEIVTNTTANPVPYTDEYTDFGNVGLALIPTYYTNGFAQNVLAVTYTASANVVFNYSVDSIQNTN